MVFDSNTCFKNDRPLKAYDCETSALEGTVYVKNRYGTEQVPYLCKKCGYLHLSPKERHTQNHKSSCLDSSGEPKAAYETQEDAEKRASIIFNEKGKKLRVYRCDMCGFWHLTHSNIL